MPAIMAMDGCIGLSMLVDRESGRCIATSAWNDDQSMRAADAALRPMREQAGKILGGNPQIDEWEIAVLHRDHQTSDSTSVRCTWLRQSLGTLTTRSSASGQRCFPPPRAWTVSAARASWWTESGAPSRR